MCPYIFVWTLNMLAHTSTYVLLEIRWAPTVNIKCILVHWQELEGKLFCKFKILVMQLWKNVLGQLTSFYLLPLGNLSVSVWMNWRSNFASNCIKMAKKTHYSKHRMRNRPKLLFLSTESDTVALKKVT